MLAMRAYMRSKTVDGVIDESIAKHVGLTGRMIEDMYKIMALADYEDRFVIPTTHREQVEEAYDLRGGTGFTNCNGCSTGISQGSLFGGNKKPLKMPTEVL
jgi:nitrate reductase beta subunit